MTPEKERREAVEAARRCRDEQRKPGPGAEPPTEQRKHRPDAETPTERSAHRPDLEHPTEQRYRRVWIDSGSGPGFEILVPDHD